MIAPSLRSDKGTPLGFTVGEVFALFVALTPSPSPTAWEREPRVPLSREAGEQGY